MTGCWVTWQADLRTRPNVPDPLRHLEHAVQMLRQHRYVDDASFDYEPRLGSVRFSLLIPWGITEVVVKRYAIDALHDSLPYAGFDTRRAAPAQPVGWLQFDWWPDSFQWW